MNNPTGHSPAAGHSTGTSPRVMARRRARVAGYRIGIVGTGNDLVAQNEEAEPVLAGTASAEERRLAAMFEGPGDLQLQRALDERRGQR